MMDQLADILQSVGYHAAICQPLLPMYLHLILSATFPIYTGAHASLTRPSSAAKPSKKKKWRSEDDEDDEEVEHKMEGLSPMDAIMLPILGMYIWYYWNASSLSQVAPLGVRPLYRSKAPGSAPYIFSICVS